MNERGAASKKGRRRGYSGISDTWGRGRALTSFNAPLVKKATHIMPKGKSCGRKKWGLPLENSLQGRKVWHDDGNVVGLLLFSVRLLSSIMANIGRRNQHTYQLNTRLYYHSIYTTWKTTKCKYHSLMLCSYTQLPLSCYDLRDSNWTIISTFRRRPLEEKYLATLVAIMPSNFTMIIFTFT